MVKEQDSERPIEEKKSGKEWLESIGWPDKFPGRKLNSENISSELHPVIPYAEKWVNEDDTIQSAVIRVTSTESLEEFLSVIRQVGVSKIRDCALNMVLVETQYVDGTILLAMLDAVESAEYELRRRNDRG